MVGARVPQEWQQQISTIAVASGRKEAEVVREALAQYLGETDPSSVKSAILMTFAYADALAFKTYVKQVLVPNLWAGACVIMDTLPAHKVAGIREAIEAVEATLVYLSPTQQIFSPIENCCSKVKEFLCALFGTNVCSVSTHCCCYISSN